MVILNRNETFLSSSSLPLGEGLGVAAEAARNAWGVSQSSLE